MLTGTIDFMKLWTQSGQDAERKLSKFLLTGLDRVVQAQSPIMKKISVGPSISTPVVRWMEEVAYPHRITGQWNGSTSLTITGSLFGAAVTTENILKVVRVGTILERQSDGLQLKVSSTAGIEDGSPFVATVAAYGNTTGSSDGGGVDYQILFETWTDYREVDQTRALDRNFRKVGTAIMAETFEIPFTRQNTKYELIADETSHQITALLDKLSRHLSYAVLRSRPKWGGSEFVYGDSTEESTMCGLMTWPIITQAEQANVETWVNANGAEISKAMLDDLARANWLTEHANYNTGDWAIVCHPDVHRFIIDLDITFREMTKSDKEIGFEVDVFGSKIGKKFPIYADPYLRPDTLAIVDFSKVSYGYYANDRLNRKQIPTKGRFDCWLISYQTYGTVVRTPRSSVVGIHGLATTY